MSTNATKITGTLTPKKLPPRDNVRFMFLQRGDCDTCTGRDVPIRLVPNYWSNRGILPEQRVCADCTQTGKA